MGRKSDRPIWNNRFSVPGGRENSRNAHHVSLDWLVPIRIWVLDAAGLRTWGFVRRASEAPIFSRKERDISLTPSLKGTRIPGGRELVYLEEETPTLCQIKYIFPWNWRIVASHIVWYPTEPVPGRHSVREGFLASVFSYAKNPYSRRCKVESTDKVSAEGCLMKCANAPHICEWVQNLHAPRTDVRKQVSSSPKEISGLVVSGLILTHI